LARFGQPTRRRQCLDQPEGAKHERHLRPAEAVVVPVAVKPAVLGKAAANRIHRSANTRIVGRQKAQRRDLQKRGIQLLTAPRAGKAA
jgi:hypothetical protein